MSTKDGRKRVIPEEVARKLPKPERPRERRITARFTEEEYQTLEAMSEERQEKLSALVRSMVLATLREVRERLESSEE